MLHETLDALTFATQPLTQISSSTAVFLHNAPPLVDLRVRGHQANSGSTCTLRLDWTSCHANHSTCLGCFRKYHFRTLAQSDTHGLDVGLHLFAGELHIRSACCKEIEPGRDCLFMVQLFVSLADIQCSPSQVSEVELPGGSQCALLPKLWRLGGTHTRRAEAFRTCPACSSLQAARRASEMSMNLVCWRLVTEASDVP